MTIVRFAPSPTGNLHVGNIRMALVNWLYARSNSGKFILRLDDTDSDRSTLEFAESIKDDLRWLGLDWNRLELQSDRMDRYKINFDILKAADRVYACYETPEELNFKRKRRLSQGKPPIYDRSSLKLNDTKIKEYEAEGRIPHWRFLLDHRDIIFDDLVRGSVQFHGSYLSDPVLVREDGTYLYMLPSTVDDVEMAVTHVIRGEDHVANTAVQIQLFEALGSKPPIFAHMPLLTDISGRGLSKRFGSQTIASIREDGIEAMALNSYLANVGTSEAIEPQTKLDALAASFDITHTGRGTPKYDTNYLKNLNAALVHVIPYEDVSSRLHEIGLDRADADFWVAVRTNLECFDDVVRWYKICFETIEPIIEDPSLTSIAFDLLPADPWDEETWKKWVKSIRSATGRRGKDLFRPLRLALSGLDHGPELNLLLPLIGRRRVIERLQAKA